MLPWHRQNVSQDATELRFDSAGEDLVLLQLDFEFPYYGLVYGSIYVSSAGYVTVGERPPNFAGYESMTSTIVVVGGQFDMSRRGARVTATSLVAGGGVEVRFDAPLFNSSMFSCAAVKLRSNGSIILEWHVLDLSGGGSFGSELARHLIASGGRDSFNRTGATTGAVMYLGDARSLDIPSAPAIVGPGGDARMQSRAHTSRMAAAANTTIGAFYGPGVGQGLDFSGVFLCAINFGSTEEEASARWQIGDANFTRRAPSLTVTKAGGSHYVPEEERVYFGGSNDETTLAGLMNSFATCWLCNYFEFTFSDLQSDSVYSLQVRPNPELHIFPAAARPFHSRPFTPLSADMCARRCHSCCSTPSRRTQTVDATTL
eukprot:SAG22_NODE_420_length_10739_cov_7.090320_4_plen_373_part_00